MLIEAEASIYVKSLLQEEQNILEDMEGQKGVVASRLLGLVQRETAAPTSLSPTWGHFVENSLPWPIAPSRTHRGRGKVLP